MSPRTPSGIDPNLLHATIKLNTLLFAIVCGVVAGSTLLVVTYAALLRGVPHGGYFLDLLGVFLPGYSVSHEGAWIGFAWGAVVGAAFGALMYRVYARGIRAQVEEYLAGHNLDQPIGRSVIRLDGHSLGLALGAVAAVGLVASTNWLVIRGTASESVHAALLAQYLPGYTVSTAGSLVGAVEVFVVAYAACHFLAAVYNAVASRHRKAAP